MSAIDDDNANYGYVPGLEAKTAKFNDPDLSDQQLIDPRFSAFDVLLFQDWRTVESDGKWTKIDWSTNPMALEFKPEVQDAQLNGITVPGVSGIQPVSENTSPVVYTQTLLFKNMVKQTADVTLGQIAANFNRSARIPVRIESSRYPHQRIQVFLLSAYLDTTQLTKNPNDWIGILKFEDINGYRYSDECDTYNGMKYYNDSPVGITNQITAIKNSWSNSANGIIYNAGDSEVNPFNTKVTLTFTAKQDGDLDVTNQTLIDSFGYDYPDHHIQVEGLKSGQKVTVTNQSLLVDGKNINPDKFSLGLFPIFAGENNIVSSIPIDAKFQFRFPYTRF